MLNKFSIPTVNIKAICAACKLSNIKHYHYASITTITNSEDIIKHKMLKWVLGHIQNDHNIEKSGFHLQN